MFKTGDINIAGVIFTLTELGKGSFHIERIFVDENSRGNKISSIAIKKLSEYADIENVELSAIISPDVNDEKIVKYLRGIMSDAGFKPLSMDGEIYKDDVSRLPNSNSFYPIPSRPDCTGSG